MLRLLLAGSVVVSALACVACGEQVHTVPANAPAVPSPIIIEAENFSRVSGDYLDHQAAPISRYQHQQQTAINFVNRGDAAEYQLFVPQSGLYRLNYTIATQAQTGAEISLQIGNNQHWHTLSRTPVTGEDWDHFFSLDALEAISLSQGESQIRLLASGHNDWQWNLQRITLNWLSERPNQPKDNLIIIQAEDFIDHDGSYADGKSGYVNIYSVGEQQAINYVNRGDSVVYHCYISKSGYYQVRYNIATDMHQGVAIELSTQQDMQWHSQLTSSVTGISWDQFKPLQPNKWVYFKQGPNRIKLNAAGKNTWQWNLESFSLEWKSATAESRTPPTQQ